MNKEEAIKKFEEQIDNYISLKKGMEGISPHVEEKHNDIPYSAFKNLMVTMRYWDDPYIHEFIAIKTARAVRENDGYGFKLGVGLTATVMFIGIILVWKLFLQ